MLLLFSLSCPEVYGEFLLTGVVALGQEMVKHQNQRGTRDLSFRQGRDASSALFGLFTVQEEKEQTAQHTPTATVPARI